MGFLRDFCTEEKGCFKENGEKQEKERKMGYYNYGYLSTIKIL